MVSLLIQEPIKIAIACALSGVISLLPIILVAFFVYYNHKQDKNKDEPTN